MRRPLDGTIRDLMLRKPLVRKNRRRARVMLYLLPVVLLVLVVAVNKLGPRFDPDQRWHGVDFAKHEAVQLLQQYLAIDTSYPDGNEIPGAEFLARQLEAEGIVVHLERLGDRNANLWAIIEGAESQALVLHSHIDVEPAPNPENWRYPPFSGVLDAPFIYGRGAFDMKSLGIAQLMSVLELKREGKPLSRSLIFLATGDEERFSRLGTRRLLRQHPELVARFYAVLTEGGAVEATDLTEVKYWGTEFGQKRFIDIWVCDGDRQRLEALREEVRQIEAPSNPPQGQISEFLKIYSDSRDNPAFRQMLSHPEMLPSHPSFSFLPPYIRAMTRNEVVAFPVEVNPEGGYVMRLILHLLPDVEIEEAWPEVLPAGISDFDVVFDVPHPPTPLTSFEHPVFRTIDELMEERLPEVPHGPLFLPWVATDARFFRQHGIAAFGYSPFWIVSSDSQRMKGKNERMPAPPFLEGVERYVELVRRLVH